VVFIMTSPLTGLLAQIESTGSGSAEFWARLLSDIDALSDVEGRRLVMAVGMRGGPLVRLLVTRRLNRAAAAPIVPTPIVSS
jgi:hypothetical protein